VEVEPLPVVPPEEEPGPVVPEEEPGPVVPEEEPGPVVPEVEPGPVVPEVVGAPEVDDVDVLPDGPVVAVAPVVLAPLVVWDAVVAPAVPVSVAPAVPVPPPPRVAIPSVFGDIESPMNGPPTSVQAAQRPIKASRARGRRPGAGAARRITNEPSKSSGRLRPRPATAMRPARRAVALWCGREPHA